jgi:hypothetical protein
VAILASYSNIDWRPVATGYVGIALMGLLFSSVGLVTSALTRNQIVAAIFSFLLLALLFGVPIVQNLATDPTLKNALTYVSLWDHMEDFAGPGRQPPLVYQLSLPAFFLFLAVKALEASKGGEPCARKVCGLRPRPSSPWFWLSRCCSWSITSAASLRGPTGPIRIYSAPAPDHERSQLKEPVEVVVFMTPGSPLFEQTKELFDRYRAKSDKVTVEFIDPDRDPLRTRALVDQYGVAQANTVVFVAGERKKYVTSDQLADYDYSGAQFSQSPRMTGFKGEEQFTSAILGVVNPKVPKIYSPPIR